MANPRRLKHGNRARRRTRAETADEIRNALIDAAMQTVARRGYEEASVSRITQRAKLAQGTFYNYFETRQDILDLLPLAHGREMLEFITDAMGDVSGAEREARRFEAFFQFFDRARSNARLINEAPTLAPRGYEEYYRAVSDGYVRALKRSAERGEVVGYGNEELRILADILIAIRAGLAQRHLSPSGESAAHKKKVVGVYRKFIERAIFALPCPDRKVGRKSAARTSGSRAKVKSA
jgi:AcrR family transcriptional regulator